MRRALPRAALALACTVLALAGCAAERGLESYPCPDGGTTLTYRSFGEPFLSVHCQKCHASGAPDRHGAPSGYTFDDREQVQRWRARIFARAAAENDSMPPGPDDPLLAERMKLAEWLACGAPE
jgi:hypothetical protein